MKESLFYLLLKVLPKNLMSRLTGKVTALELPPPFGILSVYWFAKTFNLDMQEAEHELSDYSSINELFTRRLKVGTRPTGQGIVHPVDATVNEAGKLYDGILMQAKFRVYNLEKLTGDERYREIFNDGYYLTYYLCPTDYHRVHSPITGEIVSCTHIPGTLWPVNKWSVKNIRFLFCVNERVVIELKTERGPVLVIMVGATNVGKMTMSFDPDIVSNLTRNCEPIYKKYETPIKVQAGDELGMFNMGSTVIVLYPKEYEMLEDKVLYRGQVKMGETLALL